MPPPKQLTTRSAPAASHPAVHYRPRRPPWPTLAQAQTQAPQMHVSAASARRSATTVPGRLMGRRRTQYGLKNGSFHLLIGGMHAFLENNFDFHFSIIAATSSLVILSAPSRAALSGVLPTDDQRRWCYSRRHHQPTCTVPPTFQLERSYPGAIWIVLALESDPLPMLLQPVTGETVE